MGITYRLLTIRSSHMKYKGNRTKIVYKHEYLYHVCQELQGPDRINYNLWTGSDCYQSHSFDLSTEKRLIIHLCHF